MIAFATLLIGLVLGVQWVELVVADAVAEVEVRLDGEPVATLAGPPWKLEVDLGPDPAPHLLEAIAFDGRRGEVGRARQPINLPRNAVEASLAVEPGEGGRGSVGRLRWESLFGDDSPRVELTLDGQPLTVADPAEFALPPYDPELLHLLRAELEFAGAATSRVELVFGGAFVDRSSSRLSAFPVVMTKGRKVPKVERLQGWFAVGDERPAVVAVEKGHAEIVVVRSPDAGAELLGFPNAATVTVIVEATGRSNLGASARRDWRAQFLWPVARPSGGERRFDLFPHSQTFTEEDGNLATLVTAVGAPRAVGRLRLADAVAVAGITAAAGNHRRAVLLVLAGDTDGSDISPSQARRFLAQLRVPLFVWRTSPENASRQDWGEGTDVSSRKKLDRAVNELEKALERQRVVWLEGSHLPHEIELTARAAALRPAAAGGEQ